MRSLMNASEEEMDRAFARERRENQARVGDTAIAENTRLVLQCADDAGGQFSSLPMWLSTEEAELSGLIKQLPWRDSRAIEWKITDAGRIALKAANNALGERATRYVHELKEWGFGLEPIVFGYPFLQPLTSPVRRFKGTLVADRRLISKVVVSLKRTIWQRLFG